MTTLFHLQQSTPTTKPPLSLSFSNNHLVAGTLDKVEIYSSTSRECLQSLKGHKMGAYFVIATRDGKFALSKGFLEDIILWDLEEFTSTSLSSNETLKSSWALAFSPLSNETIACTSTNGIISILDVKDNLVIANYDTKGLFGMCIDWSKDGRYIVSGHQKGGLFVYNTEQDRLLHSLPGHAPKVIRSVVISPNSRQVASAGDSMVIALHDLEYGQQIGLFTGHDSWIFSLDWHPDGTFLLSSSMDGKTKVWHTLKKECVNTEGEASQAIYSAKWNRQGTAFCAASADNTIRWYQSSGQ